MARPRFAALRRRRAVAVLLALLGLLTAAAPAPPSRAVQRANAARVLAWSQRQLGVREATGRNDGPMMDAWLRLVGSPRFSPWCGAYQGAGQQASALPMPAGAGAARSWTLPQSARTYYLRGLRGSVDSLQPGHQVTFYYPNLGRIGHVGRALSPTRALLRGRPARGWVVNEGNTGSGGGREGAGVHNITHAASDIYGAANWLY
ncbi:hypothetical protein [Hymenobacter siberiensis]|uniref:hypothetical protein n=1 Tax=Hymenobacter siberiensis TaxID=2848396 RepID=UPI001C1E3B7B|nr:hypothetical protein [Hymenobacter siberiensis]